MQLTKTIFRILPSCQFLLGKRLQKVLDHTGTGLGSGQREEKGRRTSGQTLQGAALRDAAELRWAGAAINVAGIAKAADKASCRLMQGTKIFEGP